MSRCEDHPCCGHGDDCPTFGPDSSFLPYPCLGCGEPIPRGTAVRGHESYCGKCANNPRTFHDEDCPGCGYCDGESDEDEKAEFSGPFQDDEAHYPDYDADRYMEDRCDQRDYPEDC